MTQAVIQPDLDPNAPPSFSKLVDQETRAIRWKSRVEQLCNHMYAKGEIDDKAMKSIMPRLGGEELREIVQQLPQAGS